MKGLTEVIATRPDATMAATVSWDADLEERVEYDQPTYKLKWNAFCEGCAAAAPAKCVCGTCLKP